MADTDDHPRPAALARTEQWLDDLASAEGVTRAVALERLVAAYWTVQELQGLLASQGDPETDGAPDSPVRSPLEPRLAALERQAAPSTDDLDGATDRLAGAEAALDARLAALEARADEAFGHQAEILEYLLEAIDEGEAEVARLADEAAAAREWRADRERLADLGRLAARLGVGSATCGHCDRRLDLGLLPTASCPHCDHRLVDLAPRRRWFGLRSDAVAVVATDEPDVVRGDDRAGD